MDKKLLEEIRKISTSEQKRGYPSYWHADRDSQISMEITAVQDWACEMNLRGHSIHEIEENVNDPPDCLAIMGGIMIGVEVTQLTIDESERKKYVQAKGNSTINTLGVRGLNQDSEIEEKAMQKLIEHPVPNMVEWPQDKFNDKLTEIVQSKDEKIENKYNRGELISLDKYFLLIVTDEQNLWEERLNEYLNKIKLSKPKFFDAVYVMMGYVPTDDNNGHNPVFEVGMS